MNSNKTAIITGASTGIGKHVSIKLSENNYNVIGIDKNKDLLKLLRTKKMPFDEPGFQNLLNDSTIEY